MVSGNCTYIPQFAPCLAFTLIILGIRRAAVLNLSNIDPKYAKKLFFGETRLLAS